MSGKQYMHRGDRQPAIGGVCSRAVPEESPAAWPHMAMVNTSRSRRLV